MSDGDPTNSHKVVQPKKVDLDSQIIEHTLGVEKTSVKVRDASGAKETEEKKETEQIEEAAKAEEASETEKAIEAEESGEAEEAREAKYSEKTKQAEEAQEVGRVEETKEAKKTEEAVTEETGEDEKAEKSLLTTDKSKSESTNTKPDLVENSAAHTTVPPQCTQEKEYGCVLKRSRDIATITNESHIVGKRSSSDSEGEFSEALACTSSVKGNACTPHEDKSKFDFSGISYLDTDNGAGIKPMDGEVLEKATTTLLSFTPEVLAKNITACDVDVLSRKRFSSRESLADGLSLLLLPNGDNLREDVIERFEWFPLFVAATVVKRTGVESRCEVVLMWLLTAVELLRNTNMMGVVEILHGLSLPAVENLDHIWNRLNSDQSALLSLYNSNLKQIEDKLRTGMYNKKVCVPYVFSLAKLLSQAHPMENWRKGDLLQVLDAGRQMLHDASECEKRYVELVQQTEPVPDLMDIFRTEFHMLVLVGSGIVGSTRDSRRQKVGTVIKVLDLLARKQ